MYNEQTKESFIMSYSNSIATQRLIRQIFTSFERYEESYGCDLSQLSTEQLQPVYDKVTGLRQKSIDLTYHLLKQYVKWCASSGYKTTRGIYSIRTATFDKIRDQMVSSPLHLKTKLDNVFDQPTEYTVDCIYRTFLWMAFSGLTDEEAVSIVADEVNLQLMYIEYKGHKYELYKEAIHDFSNACTMTEFWYRHPNYSVKRSRAEGNLVLRGFLSPEVKVKTLRPIITHRLKDFAFDDQGNKIHDGYKLSYNRIYLSGIFYRAYERERIGIPVNFSAYVDKEINQDASKNKTVAEIANAKAEEYIQDYERWKNAFDA